jgi:hypothetical protein
MPGMEHQTMASIKSETYQVDIMLSLLQSSLTQLPLGLQQALQSKPTNGLSQQPMTFLAFTNTALNAVNSNGDYAIYFRSKEGLAGLLSYHALIGKDWVSTNTQLKDRNFAQSALSQPGVAFNQIGFGKNQSVIVYKENAGSLGSNLVFSSVPGLNASIIETFQTYNGG